MQCKRALNPDYKFAICILLNVSDICASSMGKNQKLIIIIVLNFKGRIQYPSYPPTYRKYNSNTNIKAYP